MSSCDCKCNFGCTFIGLIASIIIGVIAAILNFTAVITVTPAFLWVLLGIAVVYLAVALVATASANTDKCSRSCICTALSSLLTGILGTVLFSVILLGIEFAATSVIGAIFVGLLLFFFSLTVTSTACLVKCSAGCDD